MRSRDPFTRGKCPLFLGRAQPQARHPQFSMTLHPHFRPEASVAHTHCVHRDAARLCCASGKRLENHVSDPRVSGWLRGNDSCHGPAGKVAAAETRTGRRGPDSMAGQDPPGSAVHTYTCMSREATVAPEMVVLR